MDDSQIVDNILKQHDTRLFGVLVEKYSGIVFSKAMGITHNKELSAEITQQTFIKAYMNLDAWNRGNSLAPWLSVISAHIAISLLDKMKRQQAADVCEDIADSPTMTNMSSNCATFTRPSRCYHRKIAKSSVCITIRN